MITVTIIIIVVVASICYSIMILRKEAGRREWKKVIAICLMAVAILVIACLLAYLASCVSIVIVIKE